MSGVIIAKYDFICVAHFYYKSFSGEAERTSFKNAYLEQVKTYYVQLQRYRRLGKHSPRKFSSVLPLIEGCEVGAKREFQVVADMMAALQGRPKLRKYSVYASVVQSRVK